MEPTSSTDSPIGPDEQRMLLSAAHEAIRTGLTTGRSVIPSPTGGDEGLQRIRGVFVTLRHEGKLRGCVGSLRGRSPLLQEVARSAYGAAFRDPRFTPLTWDELEGLDVHISVLSEPAEVSCRDEEDLVRQLRPGIDGVILSDGAQLGTFLPDVWQTLPTAEEFLAHLRLKAGLAADHWSPTLKIERYTTQSFPH